MNGVVDLYFDNSFPLCVSSVWNCSYVHLKRCERLFAKKNMNDAFIEDYRNSWKEGRERLLADLSRKGLDPESILSEIEVPLSPSPMTFDMNAGDISASGFSDADEEKRFYRSRVEARELCHGGVRLSFASLEENRKIYRNDIRHSLKVLKEISSGKTRLVRIWRGDNSTELADFLFLMYRLKDCDVTIRDYYLPLRYKSKGKTVHRFLWGQLSDDQALFTLALGKTLSKE